MGVSLTSITEVLFGNIVGTLTRGYRRVSPNTLTDNDFCMDFSKLLFLRISVRHSVCSSLKSPVFKARQFSVSPIPSEQMTV